MKQGPENPVQKYVGHLNRIAWTCHFYMTCSADNCDNKYDFSNEMVLDQLIQGLNDDDIQKKVLVCKKEGFNIEKLVINEECGKGTQKDSKAGDTSANLAPVSTIKRIKKLQHKSSYKQTPGSGSKCSHCGSSYHIYEELEDKSKYPAHGQTCGAYNKPHHFDIICRSKYKKKENNEADADLISLLKTMYS